MIRKPTEHTPEQLCQQFARSLRECMRARGRTYLRWGDTIDGLRITVGSKESEETVDDAADLPEPLRVSRPATRQAYRALVALRAEVEPDAVVMPADSAALLRPDDPLHLTVSMDTLNHSLRDLRDRDLAWSHPARGWVLGCERPRLPISAGQSDRPSAAADPAYAGDAAGTFARRLAEVGVMGIVSKKVFWVPGEKTEYGIVVVDAVTEEGIASTERTGVMRVPTRSGKLARSPAVRGELLRTEGKYAVVKLPGGRKVQTRILGDWQLAGRTEPEETEVGA